MAPAAPPATGRHAFARDGTRLWFEVAGADPEAPAVLLVMGLGLRGAVWGETRDRLVAAGFRAITMDNRGMGGSDPSPAPFTTADMARDAVTVLRAAGVQRAHVVGVSLGGMVAQLLAADHARRVRGLVLQSTTAGRPRYDFVPATAGLRAARLLWARESGDPERTGRAALRLLTTPAYARRADPRDPRVRAVLEFLAEQVARDAWLAQAQAASRHRAWRRLRAIRAPTLVQHGARDGIVRAAAGRAIARRIPGARLEVYRGAGHLLALQRPESIDALITFLQACDREFTRSAGAAAAGPAGA